jgi:hypothetical protein
MASTQVEDESGSERTLPPPPAQIPDHKLLRIIGKGSYGVVWLARNVFGTLRAVKVVYRNRFNEQRPYDREFCGIKKFEPISGTHDGLVKLLHVGQNHDSGYFYYVMELADDAEGSNRESGSPPSGQTMPLRNFDPDTYRPHTLESEVLLRGRLPTSDCVRYALALSHALEHLHYHNLVHRDIKPSNIIFVNGRPKLADIGTVSEIGGPTSLVGTVGFMAPEGPGTREADIFSFGKVLYVISTGKRPEEWPDPMTSLGELGDGKEWLELNEMIERACKSNAEQRYQSASDLRRDLSLLAKGKSVQRSYWRRNTLRLIGGTAVLVAVVGSIWIGIREAGTPVSVSVQPTVTAQVEWREYPIKVVGRTTENGWGWHDIAWLDNFGWLVGGRDENGGPLVPVGSGRMLFTRDRGESWQPSDSANFESGSGTNSHFGSLWTNVGPITCIAIDRPYGPYGKISHTNGWISTSTGVYFTDDAANPDAKWIRSTPSPDGPDGYSYFSRLLRLWNPERLYAVGWQGIAHWTEPGPWEVQKKTFSYDISDMAWGAGDMWAVGRSGEDEFGARGSDSHGAVYRLRNEKTQWERVPLDGIEFKRGQELCGMATVSGDIFAVGTGGLIIRGNLQGTNCYWKALRSETRMSLFSIACNPSTSVLWVVGDHGTILKSKDNGDTWTISPCKNQYGNPVIAPLNYVRFTGPGPDDAWIVGGDMVLRYQPLR